jgi:hypothetical protein
MATRLSHPTSAIIPSTQSHARLKIPHPPGSPITPTPQPTTQPLDTPKRKWLQRHLFTCLLINSFIRIPLVGLGLLMALAVLIKGPWSPSAPSTSTSPVLQWTPCFLTLFWAAAGIAYFAQGFRTTHPQIALGRVRFILILSILDTIFVLPIAVLLAKDFLFFHNDPNVKGAMVSLSVGAFTLTQTVLAYCLFKDLRTPDAPPPSSIP